MKGKDIRYFWRIGILLFALSVTIPLLPCNCINSYGFFGEVKTITVAKEATNEITLISSKMSVQRRQKGINILNIWFILWIMIICICLLMCAYKLPQEDTIVDRKVRMDN